METKSRLCQLVSQGEGSYKYLDNGANRSYGQVHMSNDKNWRGTYWLVRHPKGDGYPYNQSFMFEQPAAEGELNNSISGSGIYLMVKWENQDYYPNPQPYIAMASEPPPTEWLYIPAYPPGCVSFYHNGAACYLYGNPDDKCPWRYQVSLNPNQYNHPTQPQLSPSAWTIVYTDGKETGIVT